MEPGEVFVINVRVVALREEEESSFCQPQHRGKLLETLLHKEPDHGLAHGEEPGLAEHGNDVWEQGQVGMSSALGADVL